ncbi:CPBP family intramembrane glutamic endopeptidase [Rhodococcus chondri]|uniref:CPBP family intramembrane metalloprotease n=1 Tax=Rhodococcus chondri TaxID=3065941 RepID=A0ABU7JL20_9NOCA|nr:CPBP family intramembrane glutamic endopeptidase [Rhodococcus sp. CC-R104]MEE2030733.1 CPBP family intramembrane metalloprotease [Rhodococcus sp. CC-R104]
MSQLDAPQRESGTIAPVTTIRTWLFPPAQNPTTPLGPAARRALWIEITIVLLVTFGLSGLSSILSLLESALAVEPLSEQTVALNAPRSSQELIDLARQLLGIVRLLAWAALGVYLLWRGGFGPKLVGLARPRLRSDGVPGVGLAALIGLPGLVLYLVARTAGLNLTIAPSILEDYWWRLPTEVLWAIANSGAEEVLVVAYLITRLRQLGWSENSSLVASSLLRGSYHLYQGFGGGFGNFVMGLVFGRYWQRTSKLWPLVIAHALIDSVAFIGYQALQGRVSWLP